MSDEAFIDIIPGRYFAAVWFCGDGTGDWLAAAWRDPGRPFEGTYRFRYYRDGKAHDSDDKKSGYLLKAKPDAGPEDGPSEAQIVAAFDRCGALLISPRYGGAPIHKLILRTDDPARILEAFQRENFMHIRDLFAAKVGP